MGAMSVSHSNRLASGNRIAGASPVADGRVQWAMPVRSIQ